MKRIMVFEIILAILALGGLIITAILFARDQELSMDVFLAGSYSLMFSIGVHVLRRIREEQQRKEFLEKYPHMSWLYERN